jgi:hypothetical protein
MKYAAMLLVGIMISGPAFAEDPAPLTSKEVPFQLPPHGRYFPQAAMAKGGGDAQAICTITPSGALVDCVVTSENPLHAQLGDAVLKMAKEGQVALVANDGSPTSGRKFLIELSFRLPK